VTGVAGERITIGRFADFQLWDGRWTWCRGFHGGLPIFAYGDAPTGLVTPRQLREQRLRVRRGQEVYALLVWRGGRRFGQLYRIDLAVAARTQTPAVKASIEAMCRAHKTCRRCGRVGEKYLPTSTWQCADCCTDTGEWGRPDHIAA
jgi:ribosomal protein L37AE/L43A